MPGGGGVASVAGAAAVAAPAASLAGVCAVAVVAVGFCSTEKQRAIPNCEAGCNACTLSGSVHQPQEVGEAHRHDCGCAQEPHSHHCFLFGWSVGVQRTEQHCNLLCGFEERLGASTLLTQRTSQVTELRRVCEKVEDAPETAQRNALIESYFCPNALCTHQSALHETQGTRCGVECISLARCTANNNSAHCLQPVVEWLPPHQRRPSQVFLWPLCESARATLCCWLLRSALPTDFATALGRLCIRHIENRQRS